ncbi:polyketide synthase dehydratase domain-containing protein, partial [Streptomyces sp. NPDC002785]|uniref:polyketide synthase dehydratase domain-containing protein n=1 Tax=Streptomyces sp. NPDC002785 TaxID=3154543 RepID=UPI00331DA32A
VNAVGLESADHPLLGAAVPLATTDGFLFTGRLGLDTHPWLADHTVLGSVLLPGTAFVELAIRAGDQVGCDHLEELTLEAPLVLPARGGVRLQLTVGALDDGGRSSLAILSRAADAPAEEPWTRHATGMLATGAPRPEFALAEWPPRGAEEADVAELYAALAADGLPYGPAFQGLTAAWRRGDELFADVELPERSQAAEFGLHPALLDSALHALGLAGDDQGQGRLPFAWSGVSLYASGAATLRVRLELRGAADVRLEIADATGAPVAAVESLALRAISAEQVRAARTAFHESLFRLEWVEQPAADAGARDGARWAVLGSDRLGLGAPAYTDLAALTDAVVSGAELPELVFLSPDAQDDRDAAGAAHRATAEALALVQEWLADERFAASRLVLASSPADLAQAAVWGLLRSAQAENPDRFVLLDIDDQDASRAALPAALASGEEQLAVHAGVIRTPRLARVPVADGAEAAVWDPEGTVLVTGASGQLGGLFSRYLV